MRKLIRRIIDRRVVAFEQRRCDSVIFVRCCELSRFVRRPDSVGFRVRFDVSGRISNDDVDGAYRGMNGFVIEREMEVPSGRFRVTE